jgi:cytochrome c5
MHFSLFVTTASAIDLMKQHEQLLQILPVKRLLTPEQVKRGKRLFNATCGACHLGGITKRIQTLV